MTGRTHRPSDWLWPKSWKSKTRDWLFLDRAIIRETTRHGVADFHVRNHSKSFREMRRQWRFIGARKKLEKLWEDESSVLHYAHEPWDVVKEYNRLSVEGGGPIITGDEALTELGLSNQLDDDILRLLDKLSGSTGDINTLWRVIEMVGHVGRFWGEHPLRRKLRTKDGRGVISAKVQRRRDTLTPLVLEEAKFKRTGIPDRVLGAANKLLRAKGLVKKGKKGISPRTFADDVSQILADNPE
jgi:hypothetical protein